MTTAKRPFRCRALQTSMGRHQGEGPLIRYSGEWESLTTDRHAKNQVPAAPALQYDVLAVTVCGALAPLADQTSRLCLAAATG